MSKETESIEYEREGVSFKEVAFQAACEVETLSKELTERSKGINEDHHNLFNESLFIKSVSMRIKELNSIILSVLDESESLNNLTERLG